MAILNVKLTGITAEKSIEPEKGLTLNVNTNVRITDYEMVDFMGIRVAEIKFDLMVKYEPSIGFINVNGKVYYHSPTLQTDIYYDVDNRVKMTPEASKEVHTTILNSPMIDVINLARSLRLPMPIAFPKVTVKEKEVTRKRRKRKKS